jgi:hypothetical protein
MDFRSRWTLRAKRYSAFSVALRGPRLLLRVEMLLAEWNTVWARRRWMHGPRKTQYSNMIMLGRTSVVCAGRREGGDQATRLFLRVAKDPTSAVSRWPVSRRHWFSAPDISVWEESPLPTDIVHLGFDPSADASIAVFHAPIIGPFLGSQSRPLQSGFGPTTFQRWRSKSALCSSASAGRCSDSASMRPPAAAGV